MQRQERPPALRLRDGHTLSMRVRLFMSDGGAAPGSGYNAYRTAVDGDGRAREAGGDGADELQARREEEARRSQVFNQAQQTSGSVRTLCWVRPRNERELAADEHLADFDVAGNRLSFPNKREEMVHYEFNHVYVPIAAKVSEPTSAEVEFLMKAWDSVQKVLVGTDTSIIFYGQTGSGKSYLTDRLVTHLADKLYDDGGKPLFSVKGTWVEVYNDKATDLLCQPGSSHQLKLVNSNDNYQHGAVERQLPSRRSLVDTNKSAGQRRATSSTKVNAVSSRSHSVMTLFISALRGAVRESRLQVVDLAGSEEVESGGDGLGEKEKEVMRRQRQEGIAIKQSLNELGKIVRAAEEAKRKHSRDRIVFQDTLTKITGPTIVKPGAETLMIFTLSPLQAHEEKSRSTLRASEEILSKYLKVGEGAGRRA